VKETTEGTVLITELVLDKRFQIRHRLINSATVDRYATTYLNTPDALPPVKVAKLGDALFLYDGWHRVAALKKLNHKRVTVVVTEVDNESQLRWLAAKANIGNGLPLNRKEIRDVFRIYVRTRQHHKKRVGNTVYYKSYDEIAQDIQAISRATAHRWMKKDFPDKATRMGGHETEVGAGGHREKRVNISSTIEGNIKNALNAYRSLKKQDERGEIIQMVERVLNEMKTGAKWTYPIEDDF